MGLRLSRLFKKSKKVDEPVKAQCILGFHGDHFLVSLADTLISRSSVFIETGAFVGETLAYVASTHPEVVAYSCELNAERFETATEFCSKLPNVHLEQMASPDFVYKIFEDNPAYKAQKVFFHLDAHGWGYEWPLFDEVQYLTSSLSSAYVLIDDFKVPHQPVFRYDVYNGHECGIDYLRAALSKEHEYTLITPDYSYHSSRIHPMVGFGLLAWGDVDLNLPPFLKRYLKVERLSTHVSSVSV